MSEERVLSTPKIVCYSELDGSLIVNVEAAGECTSIRRFVATGEGLELMPLACEPADFVIDGDTLHTLAMISTAYELGYTSGFNDGYGAVPANGSTSEEGGEA